MFLLGQNIYPPVDVDAFAPIEDVRPYAGWLHLATGIGWKDGVAKNTLVHDIGVVVSWSTAGQTQCLVGDLLDIDNPPGWEGVAHAGMAVGTVWTFANVGAVLRAGLNLADNFGTPGVGPSAPLPNPAVAKWPQTALGSIWAPICSCGWTALEWRGILSLMEHFQRQPVGRQIPVRSGLERGGA